MTRSIFSLLAARTAGDPLTAEEREQLTAYDERTVRAYGWALKQRGDMTIDEVLSHVPTGHEFEDLRPEIVGHFEELTIEELRVYVCQLLFLVEMFERRNAHATGATRRTTRGAGRSSALKRRLRGKALVHAIDALKRQNPDLTDTDAVRKYLQGSGEGLSDTRVELDRRVAAELKRLQRARRK